MADLSPTTEISFFWTKPLKNHSSQSAGITAAYTKYIAMATGVLTKSSAVSVVSKGANRSPSNTLMPKFSTYSPPMTAGINRKGNF
jgi:hypothetical protein